MLVKVTEQIKRPGSTDKLILSSLRARQPRPSREARELHGRWISPYAAELAKPRAPEVVWGQMCLFFPLSFSYWEAGDFLS